MNKVLLFVFVSLSVFFTACDDDSEPIYMAWGITYLDDASVLGYTILLDDSAIVVPQSSDVPYEAKDMDRMKVFFQLDGESDIADAVMDAHVTHILLYALKDVVVKQSSGLDDFGFDPIAVYDETVWQSNHLLNIPYSINVGYDQLRAHSVNLVYYPDSLSADGVVYLELRHNMNNDNDEMTIKSVCSFDMQSVAPFQDVADSVAYSIVVNPGVFDSALSKLEGYYYNPEYLK